MKRDLSILCRCLLLLGIAGCEAPKQSQTVPVCRQVHAFYYPWYGNPETDGEYIQWNHKLFLKDATEKQFLGGDDIGANFYPLLGCYSANDETLIAAHMQMLRRAGIGTISLSWWGPGTITDRAVPKTLEAAARFGIQVNFHIEPFKGRNAHTTREAICYLIDHYGSSPAFQREAALGGRPFFYIYDSYLTPAHEWAEIFDPDAPATIRNTKYDAVILGLWVKESEGAFLLAGHFDGFYTYFATDGFTYGSTSQHWSKLSQWAKNHNKLFVPCVGPGYSDTRIRPWNDENTRLRAAGEYFDRMFAAALAVTPGVIGITSFNEWQEGTQIEPAKPDKTIGDYTYLDYKPLAPEYYLDRTRYWVEQFCKEVAVVK